MDGGRIALASLVCGGISLLLPVAILVALGLSRQTLATTPDWIYGSVVILTLTAAVAGIVLAGVNLASPHWTVTRTRIRLAMHAAAFVILLILARAGSWLVAADGIRDPARFAGAIEIANQISFYCLVCALVITGLQLAWECVKHFRDPLSPPAAQRRHALRKS